MTKSRGIGRGGKREGAGRKHTGRKVCSLRLTDREVIAIYNYLIYYRSNPDKAEKHIQFLVEDGENRRREKEARLEMAAAEREQFHALQDAESNIDAILKRINKGF